MNQTKKFWALLCCMMASNIFAQQQVILQFQGEDQFGNYVQLSKVILSNLPQEWSDTLYYPDTIAVLTVGNSSITDNHATALGLSQNTPNPFQGTTQVTIAVPENSPLSLEVMDINGRLVAEQNFSSITPGTHQFSIKLSTPQTYFLTAHQNGNLSSIKMLNKGNSGMDKIEYEGITSDKNEVIKTKNNTKGIINHPFAYGDAMTYKGYAIVYGQEIESEIVAKLQILSETIILSFEVEIAEDGQPCPGAATVNDIDNNTYNTVVIGNQCWMKESLRTTHYTNGTSIPLGSSTSTTIAYRYYPDNNSSNVSTYGYLYNWKAVMGTFSSSSNNPSDVQGICPKGWHVPSDAEWTQLTDYVCNQSQYLCANNNTYIAKAFASTILWNNDPGTCTVGNTLSANNATGFSAFPAGFYYGNYINLLNSSHFWSATQYDSDNAFDRAVAHDYAIVPRMNYNKGHGFAVRCLRQYLK